MKRSKDPSRLLRPHGNRANLQRHSTAQVPLVPSLASAALPQTDEEASIPTTQTTAASRWRRRRNTY